jgi:hypothetical protein
VNREQEWSFVWALADSAAEFMKPDVHVRLCAKIGAGEYDGAIADLLVSMRIGGPLCRTSSLLRYGRGYEGTQEPTVSRFFSAYMTG